MKALPRNDAKTRIGKFLAGEKILLASDEEKILARWELAAESLRKKTPWVEIRDNIVTVYGVSSYTAENDIGNAQEVFGMTRKINKRFHIHLHLERLDMDLERTREAIFWGKDPEGNRVAKVPDSKEIAALAKLHETYTYTLNSLPQDDDRKSLPPPILVFSLPNGVSLPIAPLPSLDSLLSSADKFIEYEMLNNGTSDIQPDGSAGTGKNSTGTTYDDPLTEGE